MSNKYSKCAAVLLAVALTPTIAKADTDPYDKCLNAKSHDICFAAMSTYEERMSHVSNLQEFCALSSRYVGLQGYDSMISGNPLERRNAYESTKMLADKCGSPYRTIMLRMHKILE